MSPKLSANAFRYSAEIRSHSHALWFFKSSKAFRSSSIVISRSRMGWNVGTKLGNSVSGVSFVSFNSLVIHFYITNQLYCKLLFYYFGLDSRLNWLRIRDNLTRKCSIKITFDVCNDGCHLCIVLNLCIHSIFMQIIFADGIFDT